jgi:hypothetical protein
MSAITRLRLGVNGVVWLTCLPFAAMRLRYLHTLSPELDTTKMFVMSILLSCGMRLLSMIAIGALTLQSITISPEDSAQQPTKEDPDSAFYNKVRNQGK